MMLTSALFSIQMMSFLQILTPSHLIGKVISCAMCIGMCASPLGQALYGQIFEWIGDLTFIPFYAAAAASIILCLVTWKVFISIDTVR